jgi:hypothetical protein
MKENKTHVHFHYTFPVSPCSVWLVVQCDLGSFYFGGTSVTWLKKWTELERFRFPLFKLLFFVCRSWSCARCPVVWLLGMFSVVAADQTPKPKRPNPTPKSHQMHPRQ